MTFVGKMINDWWPGHLLLWSPSAFKGRNHHCGILILTILHLISTTHTTTANVDPYEKEDLGIDNRLQHHKVDLLAAAGLFEQTANFSVHHEGVILRPGPHSATPAALFSGTRSAERRVKIHLGTEGPHVAKELRKLLAAGNAEDIALLASVKQSRGNSGTLFALNAGQNRFLEVQSSGRQNQLRLIYRTRVSHSEGSWVPLQAVESLPLSLADDQWHKLAVTLSGNQLQVFLDCQSIHRRIIRPLDFRIPVDDVTLWLGQQSEKRFLYKGYIQNFHLVSGQNGHALQCPSTDGQCPTCGEFRTLQQTVREVHSEYLEEIRKLQQRLEEVESRLSKVEECDCRKSCRLPGGVIRDDGASWADGCQLCSCVRGVVTCRPAVCPPLDCTDPNPPDPSLGICCPTCKAECRQNNTVYPHGSTFRPRRCVFCKCDNGHMSCSRQEECPQLNCSVEEQILEEGQCCKVCRADFCSRGHDCHQEFGECRNGLHNYTCHCKPGFNGDGHHCEDHNECEQLGDVSGSGGHFCTGPNTKCVNTPGSYECMCQEGYEAESHSGLLSCRPINMCLNNNSSCHGNATCKYLGPAQFQCKCQEGFSGNGTDCQPICDNGCENGGECVAPGQCECPRGFSGLTCQTDVDECALGPEVHKCMADARCINKPGWHYCECRTGYRPYQDPALAGATICVDEDECEMGSHTCHPSAQCWNTVGSYQCYCGHQYNQQCSTACVVEGQSHVDGSTWSDGCNECKCESGKTECQPRQCDCSNLNSVDQGCCPHCFERHKCQLVHPTGLVQEYNPGERWLFNCQECECLHGEIDCWPMECPPTYCSHPVVKPGQCCPSCAEDDLNCTANNTSSSATFAKKCFHMGREFASGQTWPLVDAGTDCSSCQCRDGAVYCSTSPTCQQLDTFVDSSTKNPGISKETPTGGGETSIIRKSTSASSFTTIRSTRTTTSATRTTTRQETEFGGTDQSATTTD